MAIVDITKAPGALAGAKTPVSWVLEATQLINAGNQLITSVTGIIDKFKGAQGSSQIIQSGPQAKIQAPAQASEPSNQDLQSFFSTPEGMKKIVEAIDQIKPLIGDVKLSELKGLINAGMGLKEAVTPKKQIPEKTASKDKKKGAKK